MNAIKILSDRRGFTLAELLVVCALLGLVLAGILGLLMSGNQAYLSGVNTVDAQQSTRLALARMIGELREAGYCPGATIVSGVVTCPFSAISSQTATGFTLESDWNGSNTVDTGSPVTDLRTGVQRGERVIYSVSGTDLLRREMGIDGSPQVLASGVQSLAFQYLDANNNVTPTSSLIRTVVITMATNANPSAKTALGRSQVQMVGRVRLRSR